MCYYISKKPILLPIYFPTYKFPHCSVRHQCFFSLALVSLGLEHCAFWSRGKFVFWWPISWRNYNLSWESAYEFLTSIESHLHYVSLGLAPDNTKLIWFTREACWKEEGHGFHIVTTKFQRKSRIRFPPYLPKPGGPKLLNSL